MTQILKTWAFIVVATVAHAPVFAAVGVEGISADVIEVFASEPDVNGGCSAKISPGPETLSITTSNGNACGAGYVTFDCAGDFGGSKADASNKFSLAQLAFVAGMRVSIKVNSAYTADGYCWGEFVRVR